MKKTKGITLIALIITIIIMLILVAVTISVLINSGLIGKAKQAGENTKSAYEEEQRLGENVIIDGIEYATIQDYIDSNNDLTGSTNYPLASEVLRVNPHGSTPAEKSQYINYKYIDGEVEKTILCRVLYDSESEYGVQLISDNSVENIQLKGEQYNDVIKMLNKNAEKYLNGNNLVDRARCVGSNPNSDVNSEGHIEMFNVTGYNCGDGVYKDQDDEYIIDFNQLTAIEDKKTDYWLASRYNKLQRKL